MEPQIKKPNLTPLAIIAAGVIIAGGLIYNDAEISPIENKVLPIAEAEEAVIPSGGVILPVSWGNLGQQLVKAGVIDEAKLQSIYEPRGGLTNENKKLLLGQNDGKLKITRENSAYLLNLLWALGLANRNPILDSGEMVDETYGGAGNFASTGGWTLAKGEPMDHYSKHRFITLTLEQQALIDKVSRGIYRPCCGNSTHFPDCNHGMAMLGLLELAASQGAGEKEMYQMALTVNSYWFPDTYLTIASYLKNKGVDWGKVSPSEMLGADYSSGSGYAKIRSQVEGPARKTNGSCGV